MSNEKDQLTELFGIVLVSALAAVLLLGLVLAVPAEVGARLTDGHWLPLGWTVLWHVAWGWLTNMSAGAMVGWPVAEDRWLPAASLYAALLLIEVVLFLILSIAGIIAGVRLWNVKHQPATSIRARLLRTGNSMPRNHRRGA